MVLIILQKIFWKHLLSDYSPESPLEKYSGTIYVYVLDNAWKNIYFLKTHDSVVFEW